MLVFQQGEPGLWNSDFFDSQLVGDNGHNTGSVIDSESRRLTVLDAYHYQVYTQSYYSGIRKACHALFCLGVGSTCLPQEQSCNELPFNCLRYLC